MPGGMDHERHRFSYMSESELGRRLTKMSKPDKLLNFAVMAEEYGYMRLAQLAREKFSRVTGHRVEGTGATPRDVEGTRQIEKQSNKKPLVRIIRS